jgi:hypothetical protein
VKFSDFEISAVVCPEFIDVVLGLLALAFWLLRRFGGGRLVSGYSKLDS